MEQKINIAELLKDCPSGMELDCTMIENVYFDEVLTNSIKCYYIKNSTKTRNTIHFTKFGEYVSSDNAKCVIFPKGKTTWEGFQRPFKDGDVLNDSSCIFIVKKLGDNNTAALTYCALHNDGYFEDSSILNFCIDSTRLATEEEKQRIFQAIKDNGYKWNPESKTLEKLVKPKFKVGDVIKTENQFHDYKIIKITDTHYTLGTIPNAFIYDVEICEDKNWKLIPNKFDISTLKPFESRVLVRTGNRKWVAAFYGHYDKDSFLNSYLSYCVVGGLWYEQCIPYEGNEHLLNTTNDCDEFYKNW